METTRSTVPGSGTIYQFVTRNGENFGVFLDDTGGRQLLVYGTEDSDMPLHTLVLDTDEADQLADTLHSRPLLDRVIALERRVGLQAGRT